MYLNTNFVPTILTAVLIFPSLVLPQFLKQHENECAPFAAILAHFNLILETTIHQFGQACFVQTNVSIMCLNEHLANMIQNEGFKKNYSVLDVPLSSPGTNSCVFAYTGRSTQVYIYRLLYIIPVSRYLISA